jgi:hypothetical protein
MKGLDLQRVRERLGVTARELAEYADVTPNDIVRWEQCEQVPVEFEREVAMALWALRIEAALRGSGLPECPDVARREEPSPAPSDVEALRAHLEECEVCARRERYAREHVGEPPIRVASPRLGGRVRRFLNTLRAWKREAGEDVVLAAFLGAHARAGAPATGGV